ncbi:MAG TPA: hypothetical protein VGY54_22215 [Polyangiaceae bacterium]|jgi:hypothetical protein|nr:hypothetical protein [Polyangiaceae bacterium]
MSDTPDSEVYAPPTQEEIARAEELRAAIDDPRRSDESAELARALAAAWSPRDLAPDRHRAILSRAFSLAGARRRRARATTASIGAGGILALAAGVCIVLWAARGPSVSPTRAGPFPVAFSRSTQELFAERFSPRGGETSRVDRIAQARGADLRANEFAKWGVR